jgi:hypothetical protein
VERRAALRWPIDVAVRIPRARAWGFPTRSHRPFTEGSAGELGGAGASRTTERRTTVREPPVSDPEATEGFPAGPGDSHVLPQATRNPRARAWGFPTRSHRPFTEGLTGELGGAGASRTTERRTTVHEPPVSDPEATEGFPVGPGDSHVLPQAVRIPRARAWGFPTRSHRPCTEGSAGELGGAGASRTTERRTTVREPPVSDPEATEGFPVGPGDSHVLPQATRNPRARAWGFLKTATRRPRRIE